MRAKKAKGIKASCIILFPGSGVRELIIQKFVYLQWNAGTLYEYQKALGATGGSLVVGMKGWREQE